MMISLLVLLLIVLPLVTSLVVRYSPSLPPGFLNYLRLIETIQTRVMQVATAVWFFYVGSCIASFLNVVAWRVPRGKSILGSSHCPACGTHLTFRDNVPIVGWLKNGGKCRYCQTPIAKRYVFVEILLGSIFLTVVLFTLYSGGINLPLRTPNDSIGFERLLFDPSWDLIQIVVYQLVLISTLFTFALIRMEYPSVPLSVWGVGMLSGIGFAFLFPAVQIVPWQVPSQSVAAYQTFEINQVWTMALGLVVGACCGAILDFAGRPVVDVDSTQSSRHYDALLSLSLCGLFLGWQAAISICLIATLLVLAGSRTKKRFVFNTPASILAATIIHLCLWRTFSFVGGYWPSHSSKPIQIAILLLFLVGLAVLTRWTSSFKTPNFDAKTP